MLRRFFIFSISAILLTGVFFVSVAGAQQRYTIKEMTPEVTSALEGRRNRYEKLQQFKKSGDIGENNRGYVEAFSKEREAQEIVRLENTDRSVIYKTIARQNNLTEALGTIEKVFAQTQRENAQSGDKIQTEDGRWVVK